MSFANLPRHAYPMDNSKVPQMLISGSRTACYGLMSAVVYILSLEYSDHVDHFADCISCHWPVMVILISRYIGVSLMYGPWFLKANRSPVALCYKRPVIQKAVPSHDNIMLCMLTFLLKRVVKLSWWRFGYWDIIFLGCRYFSHKTCWAVTIVVHAFISCLGSTYTWIIE